MTNRFVNTASTPGGDGTTNGTAGANRAFASLAEALDSLPATLTDAYTITCSGATADTTTVNQAHWDFDTSATNFLTIVGDNTTGKYNPNAYHIEVTNQHGIYNSQASHVRIQKVQVQVTANTSTGDNYNCFRLATANNNTTNIDHRFEKCIAKMVVTGTDNVYGFDDSDPVTFTGTCKRINCLAYGGGFAGFQSDGSSWATSNLYNYNCTAYGNEFNFIDVQICKNCLATANTTGDGFDFAFTGSSGHNNNASGDTSAVGTSSRISQTFSFVNAGAGDFHLQSGDTGAKGFGATDPGSGLYSDDIDGDTRNAPWDIGIDQVATPAIITHWYGQQRSNINTPGTYSSRARLQNRFWFSPQDTTFTPPTVDTYNQLPQPSGVRDSATRFTNRAILASMAFWRGQNDPGLPQPIPDTYQPPFQTPAHWDSVERRKNRALFASYLNWGGGGDTIALPAQHTYTQPIAISPRFELRQYNRNMRVLQGLLWNEDTSQSAPLAVQPDTYIQPIQGVYNIRRVGQLYTATARRASGLGWNFPQDASLAPPSPDTFIQPIQGLYSLGGLNKQLAQRARIHANLLWQRARNESVFAVQPHTYVQPIPGVGVLEQLRRQQYATALRANNRLWENYPFLSVPPPTLPPTNVTLTANVGSLLLTWNAVVGALSYNVYRGLITGQEQYFATVDVTTFLDTDVVRGTTYFYYVTAVIILESLPSNEVYGVPLAGTSLEGQVTGISREREKQEWYTCDRCGFHYPRNRMVNQNGLNLCRGSMTNNCYDLPGHSAAERQLDVPYEQRPEPLPNEDVDL